MDLIIPQQVTETPTLTQAGETYYRDYDGYLTLADPNTVRPWFDGAEGNRGVLVEEEAEQLLTQPELFSNAYWTKTAGTVTAGETDPTGVSTRAFLFEGSGATGSISRAGIAAGTYVFSVFLKDVDTGVVTLDIDGVEYDFNISTGETAVPGAIIEPYADDWYRCSIPYMAAGSHSIFIEIGNSDVIVFGANLTANSLSSYIDSAATRAADVLSPIGTSGRLLWSNIPLDDRQNNFLWSEEFENAVWATTSLTVTDNQATAPDGTMTAALMGPAASSANFLAQDYAYVSGEQYCVSLHVKKVGAETGNVEFETIGTGFTAATLVYDYDADSWSGDTGDFETYGSEVLDNDWVRIYASATAISTTTDGDFRFVANGSTFTQGYYIWGAQLDTGVGEPSEYVKTTSAAFNSVWVMGESYAVDAVVSYNNKNWRSNIADNEDRPDTGASKPVPTWTDLNSVNRWIPYNLTTGVNPAATNPNRIQYIVQYPALVSGLFLGNMRGATLQIDVANLATGEIVKTIGPQSLVEVGGRGNWWGYLFVSPAQQRRYVNLGLSAFAGTVIIVTIEGAEGSEIQLGKHVAGDVKSVGQTLSDTYPKVEINDLSVDEVDDFGNITLITRDTFEEMTLLVKVTNDEKNYVRNVYRDIGRQFVVAVGDENSEELILYAQNKSFNMDSSGPLIDNNTYTARFREVTSG